MTKQLRDILKIIIGNILLTAAYAFITVPNKIVNGGVTSCSLIISNFLPVDISIIANIFTVILLALCFFKLGKENFLKSIISSICYMGFLSFFRSLGIEFIMNPLICVVIASILVGMGYYLCISANASTVGFDVIALIVNKKYPMIQVGTTIRVLSIAVLTMGLFTYGYMAVIFGILFSVLETQVMNVLIKLEIKRRQGEEINELKTRSI